MIAAFTIGSRGHHPTRWRANKALVMGLVASAAIVAVTVFALAHYLYGNEWALARAEARWEASGIDAYTMEVQVTRGFIAERWRIVVDKDGVRAEPPAEVPDDWATDPNVAPPPTIESLYRDARRILERQPFWPWQRYWVEARIDPNGVPLDFEMDRDDITDQGLGWIIDRFEVL